MTAKGVLWVAGLLGVVLVAASVADLAKRALSYVIVAAIAFAVGRVGARRAVAPDEPGER
jgi:hypothetical protein